MIVEPNWITIYFINFEMYKGMDYFQQYLKGNFLEKTYYKFVSALLVAYTHTWDEETELQ